MKKLLTITGVITLFIGLTAVKGAKAQEFGIAGRGHFMRVESRDQNNRVASGSEIAFGETVFSKLYSTLSPAGAGRWHRNPAIPVKTNLKQTRNLEFPEPGITLFYSDDHSIKEITGKFLSSTSSFMFFGLTLTIISLILTFKENPPSLDEPRFRVPVQIE
ncbi:MAG: hypothetical protein ACQEQC_07800 [Elusimicrobiota bacterium]